MNPEWFMQQGYRCRMDWGRRGTRAAAERGDILVIVDVLRFSTAVAVAVHRGGILFPCRDGEDREQVARRQCAEIASYRTGEAGRYSLSPLSFLDIAPGTRVVLTSPNGATCSRYAGDVPHLFVGALVNARATANAINRLLDARDLDVTVIACGERWNAPDEDGALRFALEDYLGAGAILSGLTHPLSPEAAVCAGAFRQAEPDLEAILWECGSGRELREKGRGSDVRYAAKLNALHSVPVMREDHLERY